MNNPITTSSGTGGTSSGLLTTVGVAGGTGLSSSGEYVVNTNSKSTTSTYVNGSFSNKLSQYHSTICSKDYRRFKDKLTQILKKPV